MLEFRHSTVYNTCVERGSAEGRVCKVTKRLRTISSTRFVIIRHMTCQNDSVLYNMITWVKTSLINLTIEVIKASGKQQISKMMIFNKNFITSILYFM